MVKTTSPCSCVGTVLLVTNGSGYAEVLGVWMVLYIISSTLLARRCVKLSRAFSAAGSTSAGKLIDAIANADTVRSFARSRFERRFLARYIADEQMTSVRLRRFLIVMRFVQGGAVLEHARADVVAGAGDAAVSDG